MEGIYTKLSLYGSINDCARTDNAFLPISEVCNGTIFLLTNFFWIIFFFFLDFFKVTMVTTKSY